MIDIPLNKALVAVESKDGTACLKCFLNHYECYQHGESLFACDSSDRKDGKNVIFKLVDLPEKKSDETHLEAVLDRAEKLGVLDVRLDGNWSVNALECLERTLDVIEQNKEILNRNAGEDSNDRRKENRR